MQINGYIRRNLRYDLSVQFVFVYFAYKMYIDVKCCVIITVRSYRLNKNQLRIYSNSYVLMVVIVGQSDISMFATLYHLPNKSEMYIVTTTCALNIKY